MSIMNFERIFPHAVDPDVAPILYEPIDYNAAIGKRTNYGELGVDVLYKMLVDNLDKWLYHIIVYKPHLI